MFFRKKGNGAQEPPRVEAAKATPSGTGAQHDASSLLSVLRPKSATTAKAHAAADPNASDNARNPALKSKVVIATVSNPKPKRPQVVATVRNPGSKRTP